MCDGVREYVVFNVLSCMPKCVISVVGLVARVAGGLYTDELAAAIEKEAATGNLDNMKKIFLSIIPYCLQLEYHNTDLHRIIARGKK